MQRRRLGRCGLEVSRIGFGCGGSAGLMIRGRFEDQVAVVRKALDSGIDLFDTSPHYGLGHSETNLGRVLHHLGVRPTVSTKLEFGFEHLGDIAGSAIKSVERSLDRLHRDHIDILFLHNRVGRVRDIGGRVLSVEDVLQPGGVAEAMEGLKRRGLVRAIGFTGLGHTDAVLKCLCSGKFDLVQAYYNLINPSGAMMVPAAWRAQDYEEIINLSHAADIGVFGIRALAVGALTEANGLHTLAKPYSMLSRAEVEGDRVRANAFRPILPPSYPLSKFAIRFALSEEKVNTVLIGISEESHLREALEAEAEGRLAPETLTKINERFRDLYETA
jgi:aryl-alcohol dehydrogenase-like predicted oxidoreductase